MADDPILTGILPTQARFQVEDIGAHVPPLACYQFCTASTVAAGVNCTMNVNFLCGDGYDGWDPNNGNNEIYPATVTLTNGTVYTWLAVLNAMLSTSYTALPTNLVGVCFDHSTDLQYVRVQPGNTALSEANVQKGPTWSAQTNRSVGRCG